MCGDVQVGTTLLDIESAANHSHDQPRRSRDYQLPNLLAVLLRAGIPHSVRYQAAAGYCLTNGYATLAALCCAVLCCAVLCCDSVCVLCCFLLPKGSVGARRIPEGNVHNIQHVPSIAVPHLQCQHKADVQSSGGCCSLHAHKQGKGVTA
jgi:hypothetical protein